MGQVRKPERGRAAVRLRRSAADGSRFSAGRTSPVLGSWYSPQLPVADFVYEGIRVIRYPLDGLEYHADE
jgi:hypothetical protein